ncbi:uncharacterized protein LOC126827964 [Patella vulgata]|uniref:uncharacterized protein LOC126827964 n=1 Tax=Patella vulgata TaxID=6465 RepID=UPI0024A7F8F8|nr:uncharacterized protein LOC126827964 [Patella vulgata]
MVLCFVYGCSHRSDRESCSFFRFPPSKKLLWGRLSRRSDRLPTSENDRICSCHFRDGSKQNDPAYFPHNVGKLFEYGDPSTIRIRSKRKCLTDLPEEAAVEDVATTDNDNGVMAEHNYTVKCHCENRISSMENNIQKLTDEIRHLSIKLKQTKSFSICDIQDNDRKVTLNHIRPNKKKYLWVDLKEFIQKFLLGLGLDRTE